MKLHKLGVLIAAGVALTGAAHAGTITVTGNFGITSGSVTATSAAGAATSPFPLLNLGNAGTNGLVSTAPVAFQGGTIGFNPNANTPHAGVYDGNVSGVSTSPFNSTGLTPMNYLVAQPGDPVTIDFTNPQTSFSLLWGTVDTYNGLTLNFSLLGTEVGIVTVTGSNVAAAVNTPSGTFQPNGTTPAFVTVDNLRGLGFIPLSFDQVVATSTQSAFEFDPSLNSKTNTPEPASMALLGVGLAGLGLARRRKTGRAA